MGTACCVVDRKVPKSEKVFDEDSDYPILQDENATAGTFFNDENDPDNLTDIYVIDKVALQRDVKGVVQAALTKARENTSDAAVPFSVSALDVNSSKVAVLSRSRNMMKEFKYDTIDKENITSGWTVKKFTAKSLDKQPFLEQLNAFLM
eukprot:TRINITY_DN5844_c0_g3_i2.p1 TRINITY_DN5844_c0_g3~~TRINITY_DN5844_c0_g3_i2.p1  ORF type:complete len:149 (+),score=43.03 TRINITY_DN5844_c0_g3_i2:78-524(+)